ncbi:uncharacterized protein [Diadema antillarum]|uniref:uncharacterized protein n=1 Tax=Diadema antillarum TaxID=105358 RepID=UPI003A8BEBAC
MPLKIRFRSATQCVGTQSSPSEISTPALSKDAERMRKRRAKLPEDPVAHAEYRQKAAARAREYRKNMSEEKRKRAAEQAKLRMRKVREKRRGGKRSEARPATTRSQAENRERQRAKWREYKRKYRQTMSAQKKRRVREQDAAHKREVKAKKMEEKVRRKLAVEKRRKEKAEQEAIKARGKDMENVLQAVKKTLSTSKRSIRKPFISELTVFLDDKHGLRKRVPQHLGVSERILMKYSKMRRLGMLGRNRRSDAISAETQSRVHEFLKRPDVATCVPNRKSIGRDEQPRYVLQNTVEHTRQEFRKENPEVKVGKSSFAKLRPNNILLHKKAQLEQCLCEICTNIDLKLQTLNRELIRENQMSITSRYQLSDLTLCEGRNLECIDRECSKCGVVKLDHAVDAILQKDPENQRMTKWRKWSSVTYAPGKKRVVLTEISGSLKALVDELKNELVAYPSHLFEARWQQKQFALISSCPPPSAIVTVMDFAENYTCIMQEEVQSAHWYQSQVTVHPFVSYYNCENAKCDNTSSRIREAVIVITDDNKHDHHAVNHFVRMVSDHLHERAPKANHLIQFSDGCGAQYKSRTPLTDVSFGTRELPFDTVERHFFGSRHGKNPCDGEGGVVKHVVRNVVKANTSIVVTDSHSFLNACEPKLSRAATKDGHCIHSRRTFLLCETGDINRERASRTDVDTISGVRRIHAVVGIEPYVLKARRFSCFCTGCLAGETCLNNNIVDTWVQKIVRVSKKAAVDPVHGSQTREMISEQPVTATVPEVDVTTADPLSGQVSEDDLLMPDINSGESSFVQVPEAPDALSPDITTVEPLSLQASEVSARIHVDVTVTGDVIKVSTRPLQTSNSSVRYCCGDFVKVAIPVGKGSKSRDFIGEVKDVLDDDVIIQYMEQPRPGIFKWPIKDDISRESASNILCRMPDPILLEEQSTTRQQFFSFPL